jgi:Ca2+-binding EF-hand superfamily protein
MLSLCSIVKSNDTFSYNYFRKGYINNEDLKEVFKLLGETVTDDEVNSKTSILTYCSNDKDSGGKVER